MTGNIIPGFRRVVVGTLMENIVATFLKTLAGIFYLVVRRIYIHIYIYVHIYTYMYIYIYTLYVCIIYIYVFLFLGEDPNSFKQVSPLSLRRPFVSRRSWRTSVSKLLPAGLCWWSIPLWSCSSAKTAGSPSGGVPSRSVVTVGPEKEVRREGGSP